MATNTAARGYGSGLVDAWHTGVGIGLAGVIPMILFSVVVGGKDLFPLFGLIPYAVAWGLLYVGVTAVDRVGRLATDPRRGVLLGVCYSFLVWWGPQVGKPVGEYVSVNGAVQVAAFGIVVGLLYAYSSRTLGRGVAAEAERTGGR